LLLAQAVQAVVLMVLMVLLVQHHHLLAQALLAGDKDGTAEQTLIVVVLVVVVDMVHWEQVEVEPLARVMMVVLVAMSLPLAIHVVGVVVLEQLVALVLLAELQVVLAAQVLYGSTGLTMLVAAVVQEQELQLAELAVVVVVVW
jgi:hypothetical protein